MRKLIDILFCSLIVLVGCVACDKEKYFPIDQIQDGEGQLSLKKMIVKIDNEENVVRASVDVSKFYVEVTDAQSNVCVEGDYASLPEVLTLAPGDYTVRVRSEKEPPVAAWENPYFEGTETVTVKANEVSEVATVVCKLANVRVTIVYSDELKRVMSDDSKVEVVVGETGQMDFVKSETRSAYFAYVEGSNTLVAVFSGMVDGVEETNSRSYIDVKPGNHYKITYTLHDPGTEIPDVTGSVFPGLTVDASVTTENLTINVDPDDDILTDDSRPSQGDDPNPPTDPDKEAPVLEMKNGLVFGSPNVVDASSTVIIHAQSSDPKGFSVFKVCIVSDVLDVAALSEVGLTDNLDLINPGQYEQGLRDLQLPLDLKGATDRDIDISGFMSLLAILGPGSHDFVVTVGDSYGNTTKTLTLVIQ